MLASVFGMRVNELGAVVSVIRGWARRNPAFGVALVTCLVLWRMSADPLAVAPGVREDLARKFKFVRQELPRVPGAPSHTVRPVARSMARIQQWCSALTAGATLADLDGDGLPNDLLYCDNRTEQLIVTPVPGSTPRYPPFELMRKGHDRETAGPSGALVGDFNEDGRMDVLVAIEGRTPLLFLRKPGQASPAGLSAADFAPVELVPGPADEQEAWATSSVIQADFDGDGHLDLAVGNYFPDWCNIYDPNEPRVQEMHNNNGWACNGGGLHIFLWKQATNEDPHWYREVKNLLPERVLRGWTLALGAQDLNGDMLPEIYMGNDLGPDRLLLNHSTPGHLKFEVVEGETSVTTPGSFVMGQDKYKGMGCDFFDLNGDGISDIFVSNVASEYALQESHFMWMSRTGGRGLADGVAPYVQDSERLGLSRGGWGWDAKFESFANSVQPDLVQARGFLKGPVNRWPEVQSLATYNSAFLKDPRNWPTFKSGVDIAGGDPTAFFTPDENGRYVDVCRQVGLGDAMLSRGVATADVDGDGRMDFALGNAWGPSYFFRNASTKVGRFLGVRLMLPPCEGGQEPALRVLEGRPAVAGYPAVGAVAVVKLPCGRLLRREVDGGSGHSGRRSPELHFGLGELPPDVKTLPVSLRWRRRDGSLAGPVELALTPGEWHTVVLGSGNGREVAR